MQWRGRGASWDLLPVFSEPCKCSSACFLSPDVGGGGFSGSQSFPRSLSVCLLVSAKATLVEPLFLLLLKVPNGVSSRNACCGNLVKLPEETLTVCGEGASRAWGLQESVTSEGCARSPQHGCTDSSSGFPARALLPWGSHSFFHLGGDGLTCGRLFLADPRGAVGFSVCADCTS